EEIPEALQKRVVDLADVALDRVVDVVDEPISQAQRICLRQALSRSELVVDGLASEAAGARDVGQRDRRPVTRQQQIPHAVEDRVAKQYARRLGIRDPVRSFHKRQSSRHERATSAISKSALAAPQSGQLQSSGMSSQRVPAAMPSSGQPSASSYSKPHWMQRNSLYMI